MNDFIFDIFDGTIFLQEDDTHSITDISIYKVRLLANF